MAHYAKGANAERELLARLSDAGFSVARIAGSGVSRFNPPDLVAFSKHLKLGFECKAWGASSLTIPKDQFEPFLQWCENAGCVPVFGWKVPRNGWLFLSPDAFHQTGKNYAVSLTDAQKTGVSFEVLVGKQTQLKT